MSFVCGAGTEAEGTVSRLRGQYSSQYFSQNLAQKLKVLKVLQKATFNLDVKISTLFLFQSPYDLTALKEACECSVVLYDK